MDTETLRIVAIAIEQEREYGSGANFLRSFADLYEAEHPKVAGKYEDGGVPIVSTDVRVVQGGDRFTGEFELPKYLKPTRVRCVLIAEGKP